MSKSLFSLRDLRYMAEKSGSWNAPNMPRDALAVMVMTIRAARDVLDRYSDSTPTCQGGRSICETCLGSCGFEEWRDLEDLLDRFDFSVGE